MSNKEPTRTFTPGTRTTLEDAMSRMPENQFLRVHRSYAVFVHFIDEITRDQVLIGNAQVDIPVSRQYYNELKKQITTLYLESKVEKKSKQNG